MNNKFKENDILAVLYNSYIKFVFFLIVIFNAADIEAQNLKWIPFNWIGDTVSGKYYDKLAITVPVTIEKLPYKFEMQLDLGSTATLLYGNSIKPYMESHRQLKSKLDTGLVYKMQNQKNFTLKDVELTLGSVQLSPRNVVLLKNIGDKLTADSVKSPSVKLIGTLGVDLFTDKILIIDFPNTQFCITETLPIELENASFINYKEKEGRIFLPFTIAGKIEYLLFDTGSSIFDLMTTRERAAKIGAVADADSINITSWDGNYTVYGKKVTANLNFVGRELNNTMVYYDKINKHDYFYNDLQIWGITGNALFFKNIIIIDYKNKKFGFIK